jgi:hypothetical protein
MREGLIDAGARGRGGGEGGGERIREGERENFVLATE